MKKPKDYKPFYTHGVDKSGRRFSMTTVIKEDNGKIIGSIGIATCCLKDNFNYKRGRMISEGRAIKTPLKTFTVDQTEEGFKLSRKLSFDFKNEISEKGVEVFFKRNQSEINN